MGKENGTDQTIKKIEWEGQIRGTKGSKWRHLEEGNIFPKKKRQKAETKKISWRTKWNTKMKTEDETESKRQKAHSHIPHSSSKRCILG